jgi:quercetin dioxygenase-like cupin family protein
MKAPPFQAVLKAFDAPDEVREFEKGRFEIIRIAGSILGRATYQPGWRWSIHVGPTVGARRCHVEHLGYVLSGIGTAAFEDGRVIELQQGNVFYIPAEPHDSWVVGQQPYVSLHLLGASHYAK